MSRLARGYLIAIIGIIFWSTTGVLIGYIVTNYHMPALLLALWRNLFVCVALIISLFGIRRSLLKVDWSQIGFFALHGFVLAVFNSIWTLSVQMNGAAVATVVAYSSAGFTAILAFLIFKENLGVPKMIAVILSLGGCALVSGAYRADMWNLNPGGIITGLLSGVLFASYTLVGKESSRRRYNTWTSMLYSFSFGTFFILLFNLIPNLPGAAGSVQSLYPVLPLSGWLILIFLAFVPTVLGFGLYNHSMNALPASIANLLATLEPAMTAVEAYFFLNERMTLVQIVGSAIILSAVLIVQLERE